MQNRVQLRQEDREVRSFVERGNQNGQIDAVQRGIAALAGERPEGPERSGTADRPSATGMWALIIE